MFEKKPLRKYIYIYTHNTPEDFYLIPLSFCIAGRKCRERDVCSKTNKSKRCYNSLKYAAYSYSTEFLSIFSGGKTGSYTSNLYMPWQRKKIKENVPENTAISHRQTI